jgi:hypothetical protein
MKCECWRCGEEMNQLDTNLFECVECNIDQWVEE